MRRTNRPPSKNKPRETKATEIASIMSVIGKSDEIGAYPVERPVKPSEIVATIYHSLGLNLETHLPGPQSRPFPLVDYGTQPIRELF